MNSEKDHRPEDSHITKFTPSESKVAYEELQKYADRIPRAEFNRKQFCRVIGNSVELRQMNPFNAREIMNAAGLNESAQRRVWDRILGHCASFSQLLRKRILTTGARASDFAEQIGVSPNIIRSLLHGRPTLWENWKAVAEVLGQEDDQALDEWRGVFAAELCASKKTNIFGARIISIFESTPSASYRAWFEDDQMPQALHDTRASANAIKKFIGEARRGELVSWEMVDRLLHALEVSNQERMKVADAWLTIKLHPSEHLPAPRRTMKGDGEEEYEGEKDDPMPSFSLSPEKSVHSRSELILKGFHFNPELAGKPAKTQIVALLLTFMNEHKIPLPAGKLRRDLPLADLQQSIRDALQRLQNKKKKKEFVPIDFNSIACAAKLPRDIDTANLTPEMQVQLYEMVERLLDSSDEGCDPDLSPKMQRSNREAIIIEQMGISSIVFDRIRANAHHIRHHKKDELERVKKQDQFESVFAGLQVDAVEEISLRKALFLIFGGGADSDQLCGILRLLSHHQEKMGGVLEEFMQHQYFRESAADLCRSLPKREIQWFAELPPVKAVVESEKRKIPQGASTAPMVLEEASQKISAELQGATQEDPADIAQELPADVMGVPRETGTLTKEAWFVIRRMRFQNGEEEDLHIPHDQCGAAFLEIMDEIDYYREKGEFREPELLGVRYRYLAQSTPHRIAVLARAATLGLSSGTFLCLGKSSYSPNTSKYNAQREWELVLVWAGSELPMRNGHDILQEKNPPNAGDISVGNEDDVLAEDAAAKPGASSASELPKPLQGRDAILPSTAPSKKEILRRFDEERRAANREVKRKKKEEEKKRRQERLLQRLSVMETRTSKHDASEPSLNGSAHPMIKAPLTPEQLAETQRVIASYQKGGGSMGSSEKSETE